MVMRADLWEAFGTFRQAAVLGVARLAGFLTGRSRHRLLVDSGLMHRIVMAPAEDALALGWSTTEGERSDVTKDLDAALDLEDRLLNADASARADGGSWLWLIVRGDMDYSTPLPPGPHEVAAVHVVTRDEARPLSWVQDLESPRYGRPETLQVTMRRDMMVAPSEVVHTSRMVYVPGLRALPSQETGGDGYDLSVPDVYLPAVRDLETAWESGAELVKRLSMPMYRAKYMGAATADKLGWKDRLRAMVDAMRTRGLMVFFGDDELTWTGPSVAGYADMVKVQVERVGAPEGLAPSRLIGAAPGGLSTDDQSGTRTYYDFIERHRRTVLRVALLDLYAIALGPAEREIVWPPLGKPTALEQAQIDALQAQTANTYTQMGAVYPPEVRAGIGTERGLPELQEVYDGLVEDDALEPEPEDPVVPPGQEPPVDEGEQDNPDGPPPPR